MIEDTNQANNPVLLEESPRPVKILDITDQREGVKGEQASKESINDGDDHDDDSQDYHGFSRRFYGDYALEFRAGTVTRKNQFDERPLNPKGTPSKSALLRQTLAPTTPELDSNLNLRLVSQDEDTSDCQQSGDTYKPDVFRLITTYNYTITQDGKNESIGDQEQENSKASLTIALGSEHTMIDIRLMMKKRNRTFDAKPKRQHPGSVIEPGEDCDDSSDNEIEEIHCDP